MITRVVVNVTRHETLTYMFEGAVDSDSAIEMIESGHYDPDDSNIHSEDIDLVFIESRKQ